MAAAETETLHPNARGLDLRPDEQVLAVLAAGQCGAVRVVGDQLGDIARGAALMTEAMRGGGRIGYAGAGSSALMAIADGLELAGTFGIDPARIELCMAGGLPQDARMPGDTEDDGAAGAARGALFRAGDVVIAVTASGTTPYPVALARAARARGARVIGLSNTPGAVLFDQSDVAICLPTPPEIVAGSTRMGAGTAQKVALNLMSTLMGIRLGAVHDGMMVGLRADNAKLTARSRRMVAAIAGVAEDEAAAALAQTAGEVRQAVLVARGALPDVAVRLLQDNAGILRAALARWTETGADPAKMTNQGSDES